ncbi:MAG: hypothetical protein OGMRLDGQ_003106, partial [Candidatus Fervidibacter sp.]
MVISGTRDMGHGTREVPAISGDAKERMKLRKACRDFEA